MSARGRHRRQRVRRISRVSLMLTAGGAGVALPLIAAGGASAAPAAETAVTAAAPKAVEALAPAAAPAAQPAGTYTVVGGDTLSKIAQAEDVEGGWKGLYDGNREVIGDDPNLIIPGQELSLAGAEAAAEAEPQAAPAEEPAPEPEPAPAEESAGGFTAPVEGALGTAYGVAGSSWSSGYHTGVDFPVGTGTPVKAITDGEVVTAGSGGAYGNEVVIRHADGHYSQYAHLSSISVSVGQTVGTGDQIGLSGSTGNSTGPHLHFEVRTGPDYGSDVDPLAYLRANGVTI
ncbi:M23 family metallopeptidase [Streptomyces litchfieldiae]|uniref:LysM peptidoglycan-binding domain-containing M23 family metallopeptidase n=1 Tax=Streptomyces litchfieldiae TaxID=3075543 RepID=A0ABU2MZY5_9ACTN|nr:LysM peptidoglycan-binding domain-containing M23 family metallopeptidase [Streptomyces sp. DSM 44938]MDT0346828.1 LysM peptidoglycan-binding domain-containing M23 family metallopeptidase [Streptomyces sp. DSM 44938]